MKSIFRGSLAVVICCSFLFASCGSDSGTGLEHAYIKGSLGGCLVNEQTENLTVVLYGNSASGNKIVLGSVAAVTDAVAGTTTYELPIYQKPPATVAVTGQDDDADRYNLLLAVYITDSPAAYGQDITDEQLVGQSEKYIYYFSGKTELGAQQGYNIKTTTGRYTQDFEGNVFDITADVGCES